tara:strand:+ start:160 stop:546 length:387 start_codon:yes stop_codon:yes gene_type:complete
VIEKYDDSPAKNITLTYNSIFTLDAEQGLLEILDYDNQRYQIEVSIQVSNIRSSVLGYLSNFTDPSVTIKIIESDIDDVFIPNLPNLPNNTAPKFISPVVDQRWLWDSPEQKFQYQYPEIDDEDSENV